MEQYRIVEKYNKTLYSKKFYPEVKTRFFWKNLKTSPNQNIENFYNTYEDAKEFVLSRMPKVLFHCVEHPSSKEPQIYHINPKL